jgi:hypothetical protein
MNYVAILFLLIFIRHFRTCDIIQYFHVSNFDWTDRLAGCEERWGPDGREVDG